MMSKQENGEELPSVKERLACCCSGSIDEQNEMRLRNAEMAMRKAEAIDMHIGDQVVFMNSVGSVGEVRGVISGFHGSVAMGLVSIAPLTKKGLPHKRQRFYIKWPDEDGEEFFGNLRKVS